MMEHKNTYHSSRTAQHAPRPALVPQLVKSARRPKGAGPAACPDGSEFHYAKQRSYVYTLTGRKHAHCRSYSPPERSCHPRSPVFLVLCTLFVSQVKGRDARAQRRDSDRVIKGCVHACIWARVPYTYVAGDESRIRVPGARSARQTSRARACISIRQTALSTSQKPILASARPAARARACPVYACRQCTGVYRRVP